MYVLVFSLTLLLFLSLLFLYLLYLRLQHKDDELKELSKRLDDETSTLLKNDLNLSQTNLDLMTERDRFGAVIENLTDGLLVINTKKEITLVNNQLNQIFNLSNQNLVGSNIEELNNTKSTNFNSIIESIKEDFSKENPIVHHKKVRIGSPPTAVYDISVTNYTQRATISGYIIIINDITEEELIEETKSQFSAITAHALRTPITKIRGYLSLLHDYEEVSKTPKVLELVNRLISSVNELNNLIENLLVATHIEKGVLSLKTITFDFNDIINAAVESMKEDITKNSLKLNILPNKTSITVYGDKQKSIDVLRELIRNAIKYTDAGGSITVETKTHNKYGELTVTDTGVGIASNKTNKLFKKFMVGDTYLVKEASGVGLGLFIAKALMKAQHGKIWYDSTSSNGSTFGIALPLHKGKNS